MLQQPHSLKLVTDTRNTIAKLVRPFFKVSEFDVSPEHKRSVYSFVGQLCCIDPESSLHQNADKHEEYLIHLLQSSDPILNFNE